jgi:hypothetical protein
LATRHSTGEERILIKLNGEIQMGLRKEREKKKRI